MIYRTPDLYLAAYLLTGGLPLVKTTSEGRRVHFHFDTSDFDFEGVKSDWFNGSGVISGRDYANNIRSLKSLVHG